MGEIAHQTDAGAESYFHPPRSTMDECLSASEMADRTHSIFLEGSGLQKDAGCLISTKDFVLELSEEGRSISCVGVECCNFRQAPTSTSTSSSPVKEHISQKSTHLFSDREKHSQRQNSTTDAVISIEATSDSTPYDLLLDNCTASHCDQQHTEENAKYVSDCVATRRRNPKRAASLKGMLSVGKSDWQARKKHVRSSKKAVGFSSFIWDTLKKTTKKRSFRNSNHASDWGAIENIYKMFKHDVGNLMQIAEVISPRSKPIIFASSSKGRRSKATRIAKTSRKRTANAEDTFGLDGLTGSHFHGLIDLPSSSRVVSGNCLPDAVPHALLEDSTTPKGRDIPHLDKDPDSSVTDEISGENNSNDSRGISFQVIPQSFQDSSEDGRPAFSGTSPESDVIHPVTYAGAIASETATSDNLDPSCFGFISENVEVVESGIHDKLLSAPCILPFGSTVPSLTVQQCTSHIRVTAESEEKLSMSQFPQTYSLEKLEECSSPGKNVKDKNHEPKKGGSSFLKFYNRKTSKKPSKSTSDPAVEAGISSANLPGSEKFQAKDSEKSFLSSCVTGNIAEDAQAGGSKCKASSGRCNSKRQNSKRRSKKDKVPVDTQKVKINLPLNTSVSEKEKSTFEAYSGKDEVLPLGGCLVWKNANSLPRVKDSANHMMQNACSPDASKSALAELGTGATNIHDHGVSIVASTSESAVACSHDKAEIQNFVGQEMEISCSPEEVAWVCCDDCSKWRSIPEKLADLIEETNCRWTCRENSDNRFADCSIPQQKSNSEINAGLGIPDEDVAYDVQQSASLPANKRATWSGIRNNCYLHRNRKKQTIDEIMVCQCKPPPDGSLGCKDECLNRMINIECVRGTCPCGDLCSNQQFQKRKYTKMKWFVSGKKGYGLKSLENISEGDFLIEYVGEVLDMATYEARQREYALRGQEHFYFMTVNSHEVIDACSKGNLGRFINHSCEPNCRTEKWMVKGEVCIGLFALRDIKKGEEITFDYNYVRVVGAAAKKCHCGAANCRGFIGGDPLNNENIVEYDLDEQYHEPRVIGKDSAVPCGLEQGASYDTEFAIVTKDDSSQDLNLLKEISEAALVTSQGHGSMSSPCADDNIMHACKCLPDVQSPEVSLGVNSGRKCPNINHSDKKKEGLSSDTSTESSFDNKTDVQSADTFLQASFDSKMVAFSTYALSENKTITMTEISAEDNLDNRIIAVPDTLEYKMSTLKTRNAKLPHLDSKSCTGSRTLMSQKLKKINGACTSCQFEGVEEKLNALLDSEGGINKRDDSAKGYLKLLVVTAASNNAENETTQSARDLSLILDALLKTKSRTVLTDIINKNGLQMLHNIMKQNRGSCGSTKKIPILRKLLKILEFLASKGIISVEQINMDPTRVGVESFRDSIVNLTYHSDVQVHNIARNFRDRWITRPYKTNPLHRDRCWLEPPNEDSGSLLPCKRQNGLSIKVHDDTDFATVKTHASFVPNGSSDTCLTSQKSINHSEVGDHSSRNVTIIRKRKSRWDQDKPPDKKRYESSSVASECSSEKEDVKFCQVDKSHLSRNGAAIDDLINEAPPGFDSPEFVTRNHDDEVEIEMPSTSDSVVVGQIQERYMAQLTVSHGIPLTIFQKLGTPRDANGSINNWIIAPGMPFHPFPPLPNYPRANLIDSLSTGSCYNAGPCLGTSGAADRYLSDQFIPSSQRDPSFCCISGDASSVVLQRKLPNRHCTERWHRPGSGRFPVRPDRSSYRDNRRFGSPWGRGRHHQSKFDTRHGQHGRIFENGRRKDDSICDLNTVRGERNENMGSTLHQQQMDS